MEAAGGQIIQDSGFKLQFPAMQLTPTILTSDDDGINNEDSTSEEKG
jgi:hypothetical protein